MDISKLKDQLIIDEGVKYETYLDHLSLKTCGIGHLCREDEPEYDLELGAEISEDRVTELFEQDIQSVIQDCKKVYDDWDKLPEEVKQIVANMMFNLGRPRYSKFRKHIQAVMDGRWQESANQMRDSRWYRQVTNRAERLCKRMEEVEV
jgi:lysozyme